MTEKVKLIIKKEKTQEPKKVEFVLKRIWGFKNMTENDLGTLIEELVREVDVDEIMSHLSLELAKYSDERKRFWAMKIIEIKSTEEEEQG